ncbi:hypothetical protein EJ05DRAFT_540002 [Pseudovirgaria hyperparasitica]|uniref:Zn(2)-C6 fungal-type domain-containing protein n=1 Tax=Pseudovirgaria hyperparasitica TaxID=470096 RepID=A0A6A6W007_9PEZI|nr:uncharacterized protein EJ05DRAFT_540002 [Pseudovirgaria hyperparasitica]KAF2756232.1 hypothetical protein EJ05DRAFT_540002 [Pseudovirgaria hyperparasitica]
MDRSATANVTELGRKKRLACDNCHGSKVRCTGEQDGCQRCRKGGKQCLYSESNMGRTIGDKKKRVSRSKMSGTSSLDTSSFNSTPLYGSFEPDAFMFEDPWNVPGSAGILDDWTFSDDIPSFDLNDSLTFDANAPLALYETSSSSNSCVGANGGKTDTMMSDIRFTPMPLTPQQSLASLSPCSLSTPASSRVGEDPCSFDTPTTTPEVGSWIQRVESLSNKSTTKGPPLDELLRLSQALLPSMSNVLKCHNVFSNPISTLLLVIVCLSQTLTLFERSSHASEQDTQTKERPSVLLHLGGFQVDSEAQKMLQTHVMNKELSKMMEIVGEVNKVVRDLGLAEDEALSNTHELLLDDIRVRIETLVCSLKEAGGYSNL